MTNATAILLAGGSGNRMGGQVADKVLAPLAGQPVIAHSISAFVSSGQVQHIVIVTRDAAQQEQVAKVASAVPSEHIPVTFATGGQERQDSVWAGLQACPQQTEIVLIHDGARPCLSPQAIRESIAQAEELGAACLARRVVDTLKSASPAYTGGASQPSAYHTTTVDRSTLWAMETPQTFKYPLIRDAYQQVVRSGQSITDDLSAIEDLDQPVAFIDNGQPNPKLTTPADLAYIEFLLSRRSDLGREPNAQNI